jgi:hypothetical protein
MVDDRRALTLRVGDRDTPEAALAMAFKLTESAQARWRAVNAPHLVALVRAGAQFINGKLADRPDDQAPPEEAEEAAKRS